MKKIKKLLLLFLTPFVLNSGISSLSAEEDNVSENIYTQSDTEKSKGASYQEVKELDDFLDEQSENSLKDIDLRYFRPFLIEKNSDLSIEKIIAGNDEDAEEIRKLLSVNEFSESMYEIITDPEVEAKDIYNKYFVASQVQFIYGDLNYDNVTDLTDLSYLSVYLMGNTEFDKIQTEAADIDASGIVDIADLAYYKQYVCKDNSSAHHLRINEKIELSGNIENDTPVTTEKTLEDGIYYIKNKNSGKCLDIYNNEKTNYTRVIQYSYHGDMNQRFKVRFHEDDNGNSYYTIEPMHISGKKKAFDLGGKYEAGMTGTEVTIFSSNSEKYEEQRFMLTEINDNEFRIGSWLSNGKMILRPDDGSDKSNIGIENCEKASAGDESIWYFEPVGDCMSYHVVTTRISDSDKDQGKDIANSFKKLGYASVYRYNADKETILEDAENSVVMVFHGHANAGGIKTDSDGGWIRPSEIADESDNTVTINEIFTPETAGKVKFVYYCTCDGAAADDKYGISMVDATYELGVKCVIGFRYSVAGGEDYLQYMMNYLKENKGASIQNAMDYADTLYTDAQKKSESSPANKDNRVVKGDTSIILDLRTD